MSGPVSGLLTVDDAPSIASLAWGGIAGTDRLRGRGGRRRREQGDGREAELPLHQRLPPQWRLLQGVFKVKQGERGRESMCVERGLEFADRKRS